MDSSQYQRLRAITPTTELGTEFDEYLWGALYEYAEGDTPAPDQIDQITHAWAISPEGYGSTDIALLAHLTDGRWATCVAWSDTTGFGCREGVDWRINDTRELAISQGLDKEARSHLGLSLHGEEPAS
ncbi:hypothetical protein [Streptomyces sp. NPDC060027]|uniref:hypothetical protein n=1 Tax=Streptomyces sp. NPDC060027 TaxID=3347040 RepID=UPI0036754588